MANVKFEGTVSAQVAAGETVTITVNKPDNTADAFMATTDINRYFSITMEYLPGSYSAVASIPADTRYMEASSPAAPFTIGLETRTITLTVTVG